MRKLWIIFFFLLLAGITNAQNPVVNFTATPVSGCAPLVVSFRDLTTGGAVYWDWDLGNGQLSTVQNPTVIYSQPGVYTVRLVVRNATGIAAETKTNYIVVNPSPTASFLSTITTGCVPVSVSFTDLSTIPNGTITSWEWDFGDGTTSNQQNPSHVYTTPGFYDVGLRITSSTGCSNAIARIRYIRIVSGSVANFSNSPPTTCLAPKSVSFINESSGPGNLGYFWDLGNGTTSNAANPVAIYPAAGTYTVKLITQSDYGCADTLQKDIVLANTTTRITAPDTACLNVPVSFQNTSSPAPVSSRWDFGDGTQANIQSPNHTFDNPGVYTVKLVNRYADCTDSITKIITIGPKPTIDFISDTASSCKAPFAVNFTNRTANATSWLWSFGDGTTSTAENPRHEYNQLGEYDVSLTVSFNGGCQNTITKPVFVKIMRPVMAVKYMPTGGCIPYTFQPESGVEAVDGIASYLWDFGDGSTSTSATPSHTYTLAGNYDLKLTIVTNTGCTDSITYTNGVRTGTPPVVDFTATPLQVCASQPVSFTDLSNPADEWSWDFGDGTFSEERNPVHVFADTGSINITLTALNNKCPAAVVRQQYIKVLPPIARFAYSVDCENKFRVSFRDSSIIDPLLPVSYFWEFGDPLNSTSTQEDPAFIYPAFGSYNVSLTVTNGLCSYKVTNGVLLTPEMANFTTAKTTVCKNELFTLTATGSRPENVKFYIWTVGNNPPVMDTLKDFRISLPDTGRYDVQLIIIDTNSCRDTLLISDYITVIGPSADFIPDLPGTCPGNIVGFTDKTFSSAAITTWTWDFGDGGAPQTFTRAPFTHRYNKIGLYSVSLTVRDANGCSDTKTIQDTVIITRPFVGFFADTLFCPGINLPFTDTSDGRRLSYFWDFGDGNTSTQQHPTHTYPTVNNSYSVFLKVTDDFGCSDSLLKTNYIKIRSPKAAFTAEDTTSLCPPLETRFTFGGSDYKSFYWDFGDGSSQSFALNPRHFYNGYSVYTASLITQGYGGCADTAIHHITISDPSLTTFRYDPLTACNSLLVNFDVQPPPYARFTFFYGDGVISESQDTSFSHLFRGPAYFYPSLLLTDSTGCLASVSGPNPIMVIGAKPLFGADQKAFCDSGNVFFTNFTIFNDPVVSYNWSFGDGSTSNQFNPSHYYPQPGVNLVTLRVETQAGCSDSLTDTIRAYRTPYANIVAADTICINSPVLFRGRLVTADTTTIKWEWNLGNGQQSTSRDASGIYNKTGNYLVNLRTSVEFGCNDTTSKNIYVAPAPTVTADVDPVIISGGGVTLPAEYTGNIVEYNWTPAHRLSCTDCPNPYANPIKTTKYRVTVTDRYGCIASDDITVFVVCADKNLFMPNTFSPNGDGTNDVFYPRGTGLFNIKSLRIFNRWGEMVFEKTNFSANTMSSGWDGTYKGQKAAQDTYIYTIEIVCENSELSSFKGNVTLIR